MAFNGVGGPYSIGSTPIRVGITYGGNDMGAQWIMAHPIGPGALQMSDFAKIRRPAASNRLDTSYEATVTNIGEDTIFNLSGGGNV
jgi:hypothetical protein